MKNSRRNSKASTKHYKLNGVRPLLDVKGSVSRAAIRQKTSRVTTVGRAMIQAMA